MGREFEAFAKPTEEAGHTFPDKAADLAGSRPDQGQC